MRTQVTRAALLALVPFLLGAPAPSQRTNAAPPQDCAHFIAHVSQGNVSFSVQLDSSNDALALVVPHKGDERPAPIRVRLKLRDETIIEGVPQPLPSVGSGGWVDRRYRFEARRPLTIAAIFSVAISIGDRTIEVYPW